MTERSLAPTSRDDDVSDGKVTVERDTFREALGAVCTPLAIVTSQLAARPHGTTVSAFCSLSLTPPLVLVSLDRTSRLLAMIRTTGRFGINVLEHGQQALATRFATEHDNKFADVAWSMDHGLPRIHGAGSWIACQLENLLEGGDHEIVVGLVEHAEQRARNPLLYQHRTFRRLRWIPLADRGPSLPARDQPRRPLGVASRDDSDGRLEKHSASASCREGR
jgi:flavin reductase (DIM6/NTAB) family NADH-FMN oxidoreductase RutF